jgi:putative CocE/NonD family hydrolase
LGKIIAIGVRPVDADRDGALLTAAVRGHADNYDVHEMARLTTFRDEVHVTGGLAASIDTLSPSSYVRELNAAATPIYSYSGWFDVAYQHGAIKRHLTLTNPENRLILGPWAHAGRFTSSPANAGRTRFDHAAEMLKFFDHHLKDLDTGLSADKPVHYYTMVEERWKAADTWPPRSEARPFYFAANRALATTAPTKLEAVDTYEVNYSHGTGPRSRWDSAIGGRFVSYPDRATQDDKLLVYDSAPLAQDTEVTGHPIVTLYVTSTAEDGAFFVYLEDVDADGLVAYVTEGQLRPLHRRISTLDPPYTQVVPYHSFTRADGRALVPGEAVELSFDLLPTSYLFRQGHRIRLAVAGADKDHFALIPSDGPPTIHVHREASRASHVVLPVIAR